MVRSDHLGVTSVIWKLGICPGLHESMIHFFRATSWGLDQVRQSWYETIKANAPIFRKDTWNILIGDGVKQSKEARHIHAVKKLFQESENSSKAAYIFVHMFGGLGSLIGNQAKRFCLPLSLHLHDRLQFLAFCKGGDGYQSETQLRGVPIARNEIQAGQTTEEEQEGDPQGTFLSTGFLLHHNGTVTLREKHAGGISLY